MTRRPKLYDNMHEGELAVVTACDQEIGRLRREIAAEQKVRIRILQRVKKRQQRRNP